MLSTFLAIEAKNLLQASIILRKSFRIVITPDKVHGYDFILCLVECVNFHFWACMSYTIISFCGKEQFIYYLPSRLAKCIKAEAYADAVKYYTGALPIFKAYGDSSFLDGKRASEEAVAVIVKNLQGKVFSDSESIQARAEAVMLLKQLNYPVGGWRRSCSWFQDFDFARLPQPKKLLSHFCYVIVILIL
nr:vacuolar protein sorting-associated protein 51 homolog [Ipomoea batatas]